MNKLISLKIVFYNFPFFLKIHKIFFHFLFHFNFHLIFIFILHSKSNSSSLFFSFHFQPDSSPNFIKINSFSLQFFQLIFIKHQILFTFFHQIHFFSSFSSSQNHNHQNNSFLFLHFYFQISNQFKKTSNFSIIFLIKIKNKFIIF